LVAVVQMPVANSLPAPAPVEILPVTPTIPASTSTPCTRVVAIAAQRFDLRLTIGDSTREKLRFAQELLGHAVPTGDLAAVFDRALDALIVKLERQKLGSAERPRRAGESANPRHVTAHVRREVWRRDGGRCTFVSESGRRCAARTRLEFDHAVPVARGGRATVENLRLRCRAHNQYEAECAYGVDFMEAKRDEARSSVGRSRESRSVETRANS
jgi:5-methylcytosine-specific restriction endonuclease McrA